MRAKTAVEQLRKAAPEWASNIILAGLRGSDAHGTKLPEDHPRHVDDVDTFGVSVQPIEWYLGLDGASATKRQSWDTAGGFYDHLIHDVRKLVALLLKGNPNVHCWLWAEAEDRPFVMPAGRMILDNRELFLSRSCFDALAGYARAQMTKMDKKRFQGYQGAKRKEIVKAVGYDVKHAAHCVRLLHMGIELARTGIMHTRMPADLSGTIREIKAGEWPFRKTENLARQLWAEFRDAEKLSGLTNEPRREEASALLVSVVEEANAA